MMRVQTGETAASVFAFAPKQEPAADATMVPDNAGSPFLLWCRRLPMAKADCQRA
jgi:hypothetical protein